MQRNPDRQRHLFGWLSCYLELNKGIKSRLVVSLGLHTRIMFYTLGTIGPQKAYRLVVESYLPIIHGRAE